MNIKCTVLLFKDFVCLFNSVKEREEAFEKERERVWIEKEKEIARLRAQQERAKDKQAEKVIFLLPDTLTKCFEK